MADPMDRLRRRLDRAIEWRVRAALERSSSDSGARTDPPGDAGSDASDRAALEAARSDLVRISVQLTDQQRALTELVEQLSRRIGALEASRDAS